MIRLTRLNHEPLVLNSDLIEHVEATPDTIISLTNGQKFVVLEPAETIIERVVAFRRDINECFYRPETHPAESEGVLAEEHESLR